MMTVGKPYEECLVKWKIEILMTSTQIRPDAISNRSRLDSFEIFMRCVNAHEKKSQFRFSMKLITQVLLIKKMFEASLQVQTGHTYRCSSASSRYDRHEQSFKFTEFCQMSIVWRKRVFSSTWSESNWNREWMRGEINSCAQLWIPPKSFRSSASNRKAFKASPMTSNSPRHFSELILKLYVEHDSSWIVHDVEPLFMFLKLKTKMRNWSMWNLLFVNFNSEFHWTNSGWITDYFQIF